MCLPFYAVTSSNSLLKLWYKRNDHINQRLNLGHFNDLKNFVWTISKINKYFIAAIPWQFWICTENKKFRFDIFATNYFLTLFEFLGARLDVLYDTLANVYCHRYIYLSLFIFLFTSSGKIMHERPWSGTNLLIFVFAMTYFLCIPPELPGNKNVNHAIIICMYCLNYLQFQLCR